MGVPVFWRESLDGDFLHLDGAEGHHAAVVRRLAVGEPVRLVDGRGGVADGAVTVVGKRGVEVAVSSRVGVPPPAPRITVVQAVPKGDRAGLAVEALTEVGVDRVVPWAAHRSQVRLTGERRARLLTKWRAWAFESSKQARRTWFCEVADVATTAGIADLLARSDLPVVLHEEARVPLRADPAVRDAVLVVGPEGGITDDELEALGVRPVRLGDTVLRTSTAGAVAAGVILATTRWA